MPRIAILNMIIGFVCILISMFAGVFNSFEITQEYLREKHIADDWFATLKISAHGHLNLFGMLHVIFGLSLPYVRASHRVLTIQTLGLGAGSIAMGPLLFLRGYLGPAPSLDSLGIIIGGGVAASCAALTLHVGNLGVRFLRG